jgi:hypothetical protein
MGQGKPEGASFADLTVYTDSASMRVDGELAKREP